MRKVLGCFVIFVVAMTTIFVCIPLYILGVIRLALRPMPFVQRWFAYPMDLVIDIWVSTFGFLIRIFNLIEVSKDIPDGVQERDRWRIIVCNHQSWVDILLLQTSFRHRAPVLKFFTKRELIWLPGVGLAMWFLGFPYVYRPSSKATEKLEARREINQATLQREGARFLEKPVAVINFVEGSRFTEEKRDSRGSPYQRLLAPRRGGISQVMGILGDRVDTVLDVTIQYHGSIPTFWDLLTARSAAATLTVREIPKPEQDQDAIGRWLHELWLEKDSVLAGPLQNVPDN